MTRSSRSSASTRSSRCTGTRTASSRRRRVLEAAAAEVFNAALYPEHLFADFRDGLARWLDVPSECVTPAHGAQALIASLAQVFVGPGTPVVIPNLTYGLYAAVCSAAGGVVTRVPPAGLAIDLDAVAAAARRDGRPPRLDLRPEQPDRHAHRAGRLGGIPRARCPAGCIVDRRRDLHRLRRSRGARRPPARRARGPPGDRHPLVLEDPRSGRAARSASRSRIRRSRGCSTSSRSRSTSIAPRSPRASRASADPAFVDRRRAEVAGCARGPDRRAGGGRARDVPVAVQLRARRSRRRRRRGVRSAQAPRHPGARRHRVRAAGHRPRDRCARGRDAARPPPRSRAPSATLKVTA